MSNLMDQIKQRAAARQTEIEERYVAAFRAAVVGDDNLDPDDVVAILRDAGRSADEFAADVARHQERIRLFELVSAAPCHERRKASADQALRDIDEEHRQYEAEYVRRRRVHEEAAANAAGELSRANSAKMELIRTCRPTLRARYAKLEADLRECDSRLRPARETVARGRANLDAAENREDVREAKAVRSRLAIFEREAGDLEAERNRLTAAIDAVTDEMRQP